MRLPLLVAIAVLPTLSACATTGSDGRYGYNRSGERYSEHRGERHRDRDRDRSGYRGRYLSQNDVIYRDRNGGYYCKRDDGTTGAIVGAVAGGILGNIIAPGDSKTLGTILGAGGGAIAGSALGKGEARCE